jgi:hypothetical protein
LQVEEEPAGTARQKQEDEQAPKTGTTSTHGGSPQTPL